MLDLQGVDLRLTEVRNRLGTFPKKITEIDARVDAAKADLEKSKAAQVATIRDRKKYELDVEQWKERVRKYRDQTSQIKTNEAYRALQHEVELAEGEIAKAEDRLLEQMVASEEYDRRVKASGALLKEVEAVAAKQRAQIDAEKAQTEKELATLEGERNQVKSAIPENLMDHYERIARKHHHLVLAEVRDEKCSACGMRIRPHVFQEMRRAGSEEMFHCETCTRILYYIEPDIPGGPAVPRPAPNSTSAETNSASNEVQ